MEELSVGYYFGGAILLLFVQILSFWQVFEKAGHEGWKSIIPIYNAYTLSKIGGQPTWVFISLFLPILNVLGSILISLGVAKAFGKSVVFAFFGLMVFSFFGYMYLGWGSAKYIGTQKSE